MIKLQNKIKYDSEFVVDSINTRGHIDYFSGLWIKGWLAHEKQKKESRDIHYAKCAVHINGVPVLSFSTSEIRPDLEAIPEYRHGRGYNLQLPAQKVAMAIRGCDIIEASITVDNERLTETKTLSQAEFYKGVFESLEEDVNTYLASIPLFVKESVKYLSENQIAYLIDVIIVAGLQEDRQELMVELCKRITCGNNDDSLRSLIVSLCHQERFLAQFLEVVDKDLFGHDIYSIVLSVMKSKPYLISKELIDKNIRHDSTREKFTNVVVREEFDKFNFVENFPENIMEGIKLWHELSYAERREYWPLLCGALQFQNRYTDIKYIEFDVSWYLPEDKSQLQGQESLLAAVEHKENSWFSLSFVVYAAVSGYQPAEVAELLKRYAWKSWHLDFFDSDTFCQITLMLIEKGVAIDADVYSNICEAFDNIVRYKNENHKDSLRRCLFVSTVAKVINYGIANQFASFYHLEELIRPLLILNDSFCNDLDLSPLNLFDHSHYIWLTRLYGKASKIRNFFNDFDYRKKYTGIVIIEIVQQLLELQRRYSILFVEERFLALSRYCQLVERRQLNHVLKSIHVEIDDNYTALKLESDPQELESITKLVTEGLGNKKRGDTYWFEAALESRTKSSFKENARFIRRLESYIKSTKVSKIQLNRDLIALLVSELIWRLISGEEDIEIDKEVMLEVESGCLESFEALMFLRAILSAKNQKKTSLELVDYIIDYVGGASKLMSVLDILRININSLESAIKNNTINTVVKERFVFPYLCVCIYSCNKYSDTRHRVLRETWINDLNAYGIDYKIVVGGAVRSHINGDLIHLEVDDTYEALPFKSLAMFDFVYQHFNHQYFYKIDDDCILNVKAMFSDPGYLNAHYFGRFVGRPLGGVDRSWHHLKSATKEAREALDLSPELSTYCDGSTGYILSRHGVEKLTETANQPSNIQLISSSYFEDKLVGDLLNLAYVAPVSEGYNCVIRRCVAGGNDVQIWDFGVLPNKDTNVKVVHTESDQFRTQHYKNLDDALPKLPNLIYRDASSDMQPEWFTAEEQSPVLEILKIDESAIRNSGIVAIIVGKNEQLFLPGLLKHHRRIGVEHFLYVDNLSSDSSIKYMMDQEDVSVFVASQDYKFSRFGVNWQETLLSHYCLGKWALIIDADELFVYDSFERWKIPYLLDMIDSTGSNAVVSPMIDFYPRGSLAKTNIEDYKYFFEACDQFDDFSTMNYLAEPRYGPFGNSKVYSSGLRERIFGRYNPYPEPNYLNQKYNLIKYQPGMKLIEGLHFMDGHKLFEFNCGIMHFKYHAGFHDKVVREVKAGQHWNGAKEYIRYMSMLDQNPSFTMFDDKISKTFKSSEDLICEGYIDRINWK